ncbi:hypothetical protein [Marinomonas ostreistagni]|uniref:Uncharacterized protein n=1 Tax=Marinomonas ostreistagni TaxID=359209 RepID=A0ABS0ZBL7_9GAMM|nr:hypothetical protein [Marinomonas ostreistagni]MBJ7551051.1 hypothetical protein [Marinomonas ostreistagni]
MHTLIVILWGLVISLFTMSAPARPLPTIPSGALGVLTITSVKIGSLPFLHGLKGEGRYLTYNAQGELCQAAPVEFIAGATTGDSIGFGERDDIELVVYNDTISKRLLAGQKTVSVDFNIDYQAHTPLTDIHITEGLLREEGFILHPHKAWSSWFGIRPSTLTCHPL